ncbi:TPA: hypothetical protein KDY48_001876 [Vibrio parahaemolyticus]|uniref:hypothetical protein n=1 Tax=Vibrio rotiferianus TaxID=190895 RepID=UPI00111051D3|nr:hypothetical protein [Vibrio rotiferianus]EJB8531320.1 hypothetical protein [Vibrio parahaemolyticus]TMX64976.1 hypothetical protein DA097_11250 [Vibrio rotiferianus]HAS6498846.1 hypothetical protein [Vibrio parahaemolyticus]HAS6516764.1 hypothetical protein [Vibrio parahaemolyticus]HBC3373783.1 hypothetical protein [Vibrio parahaemolyticus]
MAMNEFGELFTDEFLDSLDDDLTIESSTMPSWLVDDREHTTYKAYHAILTLRAEAETMIKGFGEIETQKTPKFYQLKKSNIARRVGVSAQSIFNSSSFSSDIRNFFDEVNDELLCLHQAEQKKQQQRKNTGIRRKKKEAVVVSHQSLEKKYNSLKALTTKEVLDLSVERMPVDLKAKLGF